MQHLRRWGLNNNLKIKIMYIKQLRLYNFKSFYGEYKINFNQDLNILVGNNGVGKSTILEAIHLALTGFYHGTYVKNDIPHYLFNIRAVEEYIRAVKGGKLETPPCVAVELWFDDCPKFVGNHNNEGIKASGISFKIVLNEDYEEEFYSYIKDLPDNVSVFPIEYFSIEWSNFAYEHIFARNIPIKSAFIDSSEKIAGTTGLFVTHILKNILSMDDKVALTHAHKKFLQSLGSNESIATINTKIKDQINCPNDEQISLAADYSSNKTWEYSLIANVNDLPMHFTGQGKQTELKTKLSLIKADNNEVSQVILIEEPENHMAFSSMNKLISYIKENMNGRQIFITTHSSFVLNKLGLSSLHLLSKVSTSCSLNDLSKETKLYFEKLAGYETLRLILADKTILVEGDSDELIIQRAYWDKYGHLPIDDGIDIMCLKGLSFLRYLEIAKKLSLNVRVVTDNDGDLDRLKEKYAEYISSSSVNNIRICYCEEIHTAETFNCAQDPKKNFNYNTLEPNILKANSIKALNNIFGKTYTTSEELLKYMVSNKSDCALKIFSSPTSINYPEYIKYAITTE
jgi:putative ATP-dependent endonuclease of OLD family